MNITHILQTTDENNENIICKIELKLLNNDLWTVNLYDSKNRHFNLLTKNTENEEIRTYNFNDYYDLILNNKLNIKYDRFENTIYIFLDENDKFNCLTQVDEDIIDYLNSLKI